MKKLEFKSIDFNKAINYDKSENQLRDPAAHYLSVANAVSVAQAKHDAFMKELMDGAMILFGDHEGNFAWTPEKFDTDTHQGLLIDVKEIEKKCEKHAPMLTNNPDGYAERYVCRNCGVELQATWTEKK